MEDINLILEQLRNSNSAKKNSAVQGVELTEPAPGQLHISKEQIASPESVEIHDFFFLVIKVSEKSCNVIPGSWDGIMAGPQDIVLPQDVLGQYVYLSPDMQTTIPREALANGFAILDNETYQRVLVSLTKTSGNGKGKEESPRPFSGAMPYISDFDDRIEYHKTQRKLLKKLRQKKQIQKILFQRWIEFKHLDWEKVACYLLIGVLILLHLGINNSSENENELTGFNTVPPRPNFYPEQGGITQDNKEKFVIVSPNQLTYNAEPQIVIGGDKDKKYLVSIYDVEDRLIAEKELYGKSVTSWKDFSSQKLEAGGTYQLQIKADDNIIIAKDEHRFWLLDQTKREQLSVQLNKENNKAEQAQILSKHGCYAEALLLVRDSLKENDEDINMLYFMLLLEKKLNLDLSKWPIKPSTIRQPGPYKPYKQYKPHRPQPRPIFKF